MITSSQNRRVAKAVRLKKRAMREKDRRFLVEGAQGVLEALRAGAVAELFHTGTLAEPLVEAAAGVPAKAFAVSDAVMAHLTSTVTPQGVVAVAPFVDVDLSLVAPQGIVPVLCEVRDPGNAGTILRSADASGAAGVVVTTASVDVYNPKTVRASAGSLFHLPVVRGVAAEVAIESLRERGFEILAAAADGERSVHEADLTGPVAVLLGNEAHGLAAETRTMADSAVRLPIRGRAESLNLAAAATVMLFESARQCHGDGAGLVDLVAGAAHDLRSPLAALRGFSSTLTARWARLTDDQRLTMIEGIAADAARMDVILMQLVDAARISSGRLQLAVEPVDLREAVESAAAEMTRWGGVEVEPRPGPRPASVRADRARLRSMVLAMVEGASWWGESGPVVLEVRAGRPCQVVAWKDRSTLTPAEASALFRARAPGSAGGSKFGLYVARRLAKAHGGDLVVSAEGAVRFTLSVPATERRG